jgi:hypothetical protein
MTNESGNAGTTRRHLMVGGALAAGAAAAGTVFDAEPAEAKEHPGHWGARAGGAEPRPIPFANDPGIGNIKVHTFPPKRGNELVEITDFHGTLGVVSATGTGTETNLRTGKQRTGLPYSVDLRFYAGRYIGKDHAVHYGTFSEL